jgi:hypothetical protein
MKLELLTDAVILAGCALAIAGVAMVSTAVACIVAGSLLVAVSVGFSLMRSRR